MFLNGLVATLNPPFSFSSGTLVLFAFWHSRWNYSCYLHIQFYTSNLLNGSVWEESYFCGKSQLRLLHYHLCHYCQRFCTGAGYVLVRDISELRPIFKVKADYSNVLPHVLLPSLPRFMDVSVVIYLLLPPSYLIIRCSYFWTVTSSCVPPISWVYHIRLHTIHYFSSVSYLIGKNCTRSPTIDIRVVGSLEFKFVFLVRQ